MDDIEVQETVQKMVNIFWLYSKDRKLTAQGTSLLIEEAMNTPAAIRMKVLDLFERTIDEQS